MQRVPVTESQGRIHTSAAGVLVMPEAEPIDVTIDENDLRIDVFRSSGPGGQSVNTTDSAVRITHLPTGIVVSCQNEKSQLQNREQAMRVLRSRLLQLAQDEAEPPRPPQRRSQVRTVDRSERIRTYNFPENRITDHRVGFKAHNLDHVLDGDLQAGHRRPASTPTSPTGWRRSSPPRRDRATPALADARADASAATRPEAAASTSPRHDAEELLARCWVSPERAALQVRVTVAIDPSDADRFRGSVVQACERREPLQHITGAGRRSAISTSRSGPGSSSRGPRPR